MMSSSQEEENINHDGEGRNGNRAPAAPSSEMMGSPGLLHDLIGGVAGLDRVIYRQSRDLPAAACWYAG
jgi:hypothetical protein